MRRTQMPKSNTKGGERMYGVYRATVTDTDDPEGGARVKVRPAEAPLAEAWARVATWQLPAKGEEVVVAFEGGHPRQPYVVGSLWSEAGEPPTASRSVLRDTNGNAITLEPAGLTVLSSAKLSFAGGSTEISVGGLTVSAGMSRFSGVVHADTVITNSVVASSYTPGAGNIW
jgi:phage baseplate assembly protein gpV